MPKKRQAKKKPIDADLDKEVMNYEPSDDSDGSLDEEGQILLDRAKQGRYIDDESEEEVFGVHTSDKDSDEDDAEDDEYYGGGVPSDMDSDIEETPKGDDGLPDSKAWGTKKSRYYNTDYVDKDYGGFSKAEEEEAALLEENEAKAIQKRLLEHMEGVDISLGLFDKVAEKKKELMTKSTEVEEVKITRDLTKLSKEEKIHYLKQESPEFFSLIDDFKGKMKYLKETVFPILKLVESNILPNCPASDYLTLQRDLILGYNTNITYYLYMKSKRIKVDKHPVIKRLFAYRNFLEELDSAKSKEFSKQIAALKTLIKSGEIAGHIKEKSKTEMKPKNRKERKELQKKQVQERKKILKAKKKATIKLKAKARQPLNPVYEEPGSSEDEEEQSIVEGEHEEIIEEEQSSLKRAITYQMAKNKGLTPRRKKEQRNPRVKHRNKFRKAQIRRKGQVQEARKEISRYGGEVSGIRAYTSKSTKLK